MFEILKEKIRGKKIKLAFPEGDDERVLKAAARGCKEGLFVPILLGNTNQITQLAKQLDLDISECEIIDPEDNIYYLDALEAMAKVRQGKQSREQCAALLKGRNYLATMLVYNKIADGAIGGATYSTADTIRPALQIIKTKPGYSTVSSSFIMIPSDQKEILVMGDCAVNVNPSSVDLVSIAKATAETAKTFALNPVVALLSFSTKGSAKSAETEKVSQAYQLLKEENVDFVFDGELQFDAAYIERVGRQKAPGSPVAGRANTFIFPTLEAGNIGYKIAQYLGGYEAVGPILQGLNAPINDLSRGCNEEEVYKMAIITASQTIK